MTAVKKGDKVRITHTFDEEVGHVYATGAFLTSSGRYINTGEEFTVVVLPPVLHVDDVVTLGELANATDGTVLLDGEGDAWQRIDGKWMFPGNDYAQIWEEYGPFRILNVGEQ